MKHTVLTKTEAETVALGRLLGSRLKGGEVLLLQSDLGGGKTVLTKGLAEGAGYSGVVSSPTFTIEQTYEGRVTLLHYDLYRLGELGILSEELEESLHDTSSVKIIEWPDIAHAVLQDVSHVSVTISRVKSSESHREIVMSYPEELNYLFKDRMFKGR